MASLMSRDQLAGAIVVGMEGTDGQDYDTLEELSGWVSSIDTEMVQMTMADGFIVIARSEAPPVDGDEEAGDGR